VVRKLLALLHKANQTGEFLIAKNAPAVFTDHRYREPVSDLQIIKLRTKRADFIDYLTIIRRVVEWKNTNAGVYHQGPYHNMREADNAYKAKFMKLRLTINCLPSCLVVAESQEYPMGPFRTTHQINDLTVDNDFTNSATTLPNVD